MLFILLKSLRLITSPFFQRYSDQHAKLAADLTWPDARLRAYLREQGVSEKYIPGDRPSLLRTFVTLVSSKKLQFTNKLSTEETRIRWIQTQNNAEALFGKIKEVVNSGVYKAEEALHRLMSLLLGGWENGKGKDAAYGDAKHEWKETKKSGEDAFERSSEWADDVVDNAREKLDEKVKVGGEKMKGEL